MADTDSRTQQLLFGVSAVVTGAAWWFEFIASPAGADAIGSFVLVAVPVLTAATLGAAFGATVTHHVRPWINATIVGIGFFAVPLLLCLFTTPQGDGDGLWILVVPMLGAGLVVMTGMAAAASAASAVLSEGTTEQFTWAARIRHHPHVSSAGAVLVCFALTALVTAHTRAAWNDPWDPLEVELATFTAETGSSIVSVQVDGDRRCTRVCSSNLTAIVKSSASSSDSCDDLRRAVAATDAVLSEAHAPHDTCIISGQIGAASSVAFLACAGRCGTALTPPQSNDGEFEIRLSRRNTAF